MSEITQDQIKLWEQQYGKIKEIVIDREVETIEDAETGEPVERVINEGKRCFLRKPDRATIKYALSRTAKADQSIDAVSPGEVVLNKCWIGGDDEIKRKDKYFFRACMAANDYLNEIVGFL